MESSEFAIRRPETMRAAVFEEYGPPEVLQLMPVPRPAFAPDGMLIEVRASTVLAADCEFRSMSFPRWIGIPIRLFVGVRRPKRVTILGLEFAGVVAEVGSSVSEFAAGDEVFGAAEFGFGAYAERFRAAATCD